MQESHLKVLRPKHVNVNSQNESIFFVFGLPLFLVFIYKIFLSTLFL